MSYVPGFAPDARSQWRALPSELQEIVLDELDRLAEDPPTDEEAIASATIESAGRREHVFVRALIDHQRHRVVALGVGTATTKTDDR